MSLESILPLIGAVTVLVNIITQVLKKVTWDKIPTNIVVLVVSQLLTLTAGSWYVEHYAIAVTWQIVIAGVVIGFAVAFSAMMGYDKLKEVINYDRD